MKPAPIVEVTSDTEALALNAARFMAARFSAASTRFSVSLSGGATPKRVYELLAVTNFTPAIDWQKIHLFWGDERFVPPDHRDSNFRMAQEALLDRVPIPGTQVHPIPTSCDSPERAAISYETSLQEFYQAKEFDPARPLFDLTLLGLGADGHTASLFPNTKALEERNAWVTSTIGAKPEPRISLTYPALESSRKSSSLSLARRNSRFSLAFLRMTQRYPQPASRREGSSASLPIKRRWGTNLMPCCRA